MKSTGLLILFLLLHTCTFAQHPFSRDLWLNESSTPIAVHDLAKDAQGFFWLGTDAGLYRFNGRSFTPIPDSAGGAVTAVAAGDDGIYCGYANGKIARYSGGRFQQLFFRGAQPKMRITALRANAGVLWASTDEEGLFGLGQGLGYCVSTERGLSDNYVYETAITGPGQLLAATDKGINIVSLSTEGRPHIKLLDTRSGMRDNIVRALAAAPDDATNLWGGLQSAGLLHFRMQGDRALWQGTMPAWTWGQINYVLPLSSHQAWIATEDGYLVDCRYTDSGGYDVRPHFFPGKRFRKLLQDNSGSLWAATGEGLTVVTDNYLSYLPMGPSYRLADITAMACDNINCLIYAQGSVLYQCALPHPTEATVALDVKAPIACLYNDAENRLWIGSLGAGLWCRKEGIIRPVKNIPGLLAGQILDISGIGNTLWVSSLSGVEEITFTDAEGTTPQRIVHHGKHTGIGSDYVYQLFPDRKGNMWMATDGAGICKWDGRQYHHWDSSSGFQSKVVYSITEDDAGHIWAATRTAGLYEYDGVRWQHIDWRQGLLDQNISAIAANASGQVVVVHGKGMDEWYPGSQQFRHYNRRLGMDIDSQSNALNCYALDKGGNVWVPFEHGIMCFHKLPRRYELQPGIAITGVSLYLKPVPAGKHEFGSDEVHLSFHYDGNGFANPERLLYRYKLEGLDTSWVSTNDESVTFPQLPPGRYRFRVQASLSTSFVNAQEADYRFSISVPLWRRWWALLLWAVLLATAVMVYMRARVRQLQRKSALQRERMLAEYEQLKSQVNPHFLFNSLNTLASLIEDDGARAVHYTIQLSDLYRSMLAYKDSDLILLSDELALLEKYIYVQQNRFPGCLHLHLDIANDIADKKQIVPLSLQMLVENAIKHNMATESQPLHIYIAASQDTITVRNALCRKMSKEPGEGLGLANIMRRYALLSSRPMTYGERNDQFIVTIPLL